MTRFWCYLEEAVTEHKRKTCVSKSDPWEQQSVENCLCGGGRVGVFLRCSGTVGVVAWSCLWLYVLLFACFCRRGMRVLFGL